MEPVLHPSLVEWVSHALFFLTSKVIYFSKMLMCLSLENRPVNLSFTHGVIIVVVLTWGPCSLWPPMGLFSPTPLLLPERLAMFDPLAPQLTSGSDPLYVIKLCHQLNLIVEMPFCPPLPHHSHFSLVLAPGSLSPFVEVTFLLVSSM